MPTIQILLCHPNYAKSKANRALAEAAAQVPGVVVTHLDGLYPDGKIDEEAETARLLAADRVVWQFPIQWYHTPAVFKQWQDVVLSRMFYVHAKDEGEQIAGRPVLVAATAGGDTQAYSAAGSNGFPLTDILVPLHATAHRCGLAWQEPYLVYQANRLKPEALAAAAEGYAGRIRQLIG